jgi:hypothetical protein
MIVYGVDFTSAPRRAKPITAARCELGAAALRVLEIERLEDFAAFEALLARPGPWLGGFDFPFGLPAELVRDLHWPRRWRSLLAHCARYSRPDWRRVLDAYRATRPAGAKYAHRRTDLPAGSSSPMKLVNPPVALMFHEGAPRLARAGLHVPGLARGDRARVALETYPGLLARAIVGRASYKNDAPSHQTPERAAARRRIALALAGGRHRLGLRVAFASRRLARQALADGSGDMLDAVLCALQAAWAARQPNYGLPAHIPRCEGWIVSA